MSVYRTIGPLVVISITILIAPPVNYVSHNAVSVQDHQCFSIIKSKFLRSVEFLGSVECRIQVPLLSQIRLAPNLSLRS